MSKSYSIKLRQIKSVPEGDCCSLKDITFGEEFDTHKIKHLSHEEIANGWRRVMNNRLPRNKLIRMNIHLSELQPHLWTKYRTYSNVNKINDKAYLYNVINSEHDSKIIRLKNIIDAFEKHELQYEDIRDEVIYIHNLLEENNIGGWLLVKARRIIKN